MPDGAIRFVPQPTIGAKCCQLRARAQSTTMNPMRGSVGHLVERLRYRARVVTLQAQAALGSRHVTGDVDAVVSLTTYGERFRSVHIAIESIARGSKRPRRLILWLDDPEQLANPTARLKRLVKRGLELRPALPLGPHKKYFNALSVVADGELSRLVTADDDILYPRNWLSTLDRMAQTYSDDVICHRARVVTLEDNGFAPWQEWPLCASDEPSILHFAIGDTGVSYPRRVVERLLAEGTVFMQLAPTADDIWLHANAIRSGAATRQVHPRPAVPALVPGTQRVALWRSNVSGGRNDQQISAVYGEDDLRRFRQEPGALVSG